MSNEVEELDGDLEVIRSHDSRYIELRLTSTQAIDPEAFLAVLAEITERFAERPDDLFATFGSDLPPKNNMT